MKVLQVVPGIFKESSGPSYSVPATCSGLLHNGIDVELFATDGRPAREFEYPVHIFEKKRFPIEAMGRSPDLFHALKLACKTADIVHTNSLWMFPNVYPDWARKGTNCKLVVGPRGTVSPWAMNRSRLKKFVFGCLWQYRVLRNADMFVASCEEEAEDIRRLGYRQPIAIVANGIDIPDDVVPGKCERRRMYFLSRIHPKKNIELLIKCWSRLEVEFSEWDLSIVGPDENNAYADLMKRLVKDLGCKRVRFEGELKGQDKRKFVSASECLVLPTHSENFGMVVAEALALGTPVICSKGAPWNGLVENRCGWWVDANEATFENAMHEVMLMGRDELESYGARGREWMARDFSWDKIGLDLKSAYVWLLNGGEKPVNVLI